MTFGEHLRELLHERNLPTSWLAERLGVDDAEVCSWCGDASLPSSPQAARIADALDIAREGLTGGHDFVAPHHLRHWRHWLRRRRHAWRSHSRL